LLLKLVETVDIVEPIAKFTEKLHGQDGVGKIFNVGLEEWTFGSGDTTQELRYDLIWNQWCLGHLKDAELVEYLKKCGEALTTDGIIVVKENSTISASDFFDELDSSVTRSVP
jgi:protein N-terminal methyltransferase